GGPLCAAPPQKSTDRGEPVPAAPSFLRGISAWLPTAITTRALRPEEPSTAPRYRKREPCETDCGFDVSNSSNDTVVEAEDLRAMNIWRGFPLWIGLALPAVATDHTAPPIQPASSFAAVEVHEKEKVSIAAEPYDTKEKESIFRVDYLGHGVMPIRL